MATKKPKSTTQNRPEWVPPTEPETSDKVEIAYSLVRSGSGWATIKYEIQGDQIIKKEVGDYDLKPIAFESFKIAVVKEFLKES